MESPTEGGTVSRVRRWQVCSHARCIRLPFKSREIKKIMRSVGRRRRLSLTSSWVRDGLCEPLWFALTKDKIRQIRSDWCLLLLLYAIFTFFFKFIRLRQHGLVLKTNRLSAEFLKIYFRFFCREAGFCFMFHFHHFHYHLSGSGLNIWALVTAAVGQSVFSELVHTYTHAPTAC